MCSGGSGISSNPSMTGIFPFSIRKHSHNSEMRSRTAVVTRAPSTLALNVSRDSGLAQSAIIKLEKHASGTKTVN